MRQDSVRGEILLAAGRLILGSGIQAATTRAIAEAAGCSEGSIYRHFEGKNALVLEVLEECAVDFAALADLRNRAGEGSVPENLAAAGAAAVAFYRTLLPVASGVLSDRGLLEEHHRRFEADRTGPVRALAEVTAYLQREQSLGRISPGACCENAARMLLGTLLSQVFLEELTGGEREGRTGSAELVGGVVATLWRALRPAGELAASSA